MREESKTTHKFSVTENGSEVASGFGPLQDCLREAAHYAFLYEQDGGEVKVFIDGKERKNV